MSGRRQRKSQKLGSSRRNRNRDTKERECDVGFPQTGDEELEIEQQEFHMASEKQAADANLLPQSGQAAPTCQQTSASELHPHLQSQDLLAQAEAASKKRKMGSTRKSNRGFKGGGIPEEEPEGRLEVSEGFSEEHEVTKEERSTEDSSKQSLSVSSSRSINPESSTLPSELWTFSSTIHEDLEEYAQFKGTAFVEESEGHVATTTESSSPPHEIDDYCQMETLANMPGQKKRTGSRDRPLEVKRITIPEYDFEDVNVSQDNQMASDNSVNTAHDQPTLNPMGADKQERESTVSSHGCSVEVGGEDTEVQSTPFLNEHEQEYSHLPEEGLDSRRDETEGAQDGTVNENISDHCLEHRNETIKLTMSCTQEFTISEYSKGKEKNEDVHMLRDRKEVGDMREASFAVQTVDPDKSMTLCPKKKERGASSDQHLSYEIDLPRDSSDSEIRHHSDALYDLSDARLLTGESGIGENRVQTEQGVKEQSKEEEKEDRARWPEKEEAKNDEANFLDLARERNVIPFAALHEVESDAMNLSSQTCSLPCENSELDMQSKDLHSGSNQLTDGKICQDSRLFEKEPCQSNNSTVDKESGIDTAKNRNQEFVGEIKPPEKVCDALSVGGVDNKSYAMVCDQIDIEVQSNSGEVVEAIVQQNESQENVETELHAQSQTMKKRKFGSTRRPHGGHRPDIDVDERKSIDVGTTEGSEHEHQDICSKEATQQAATLYLLAEPQSLVSEVSLGIIDLPTKKGTTESKEEKRERKMIDAPPVIMSNPSVHQIDSVILEENSKSEDRREVIEQRKSAVEDDSREDSNEPSIITQLQNISTCYDASQEASMVIKDHDIETTDRRGPSQVYVSPTGGTVELISKAQGSLDMPVNTENEAESDRMPWNHSISVDHLNEPTKRESELESMCSFIQESKIPHENVMTVYSEPITSDETQRREQFHAVDQRNTVEDARGEKDNEDRNEDVRRIEMYNPPSSKNDVIGGDEETINFAPTEDSSTKDFIAGHSEKYMDSGLSCQTTELVLDTNIQPPTVTEHPDSKEEDINSKENAETSNRSDSKGEERKWKDIEGTEGIEQDEEERETSHQAAFTDLVSEPPSAVSGVSLGTLDSSLEKVLTDLNHETGLTDIVVYHNSNEVSKVEELVEITEEHGKSVADDERAKSTSSYKQDMPPVITNIENDTSTYHTSPQKATLIVEERGEESTANEMIAVEATGGTEYDEEDTQSKETNHQAASADLLFKKPRALSEVSSGILGPLLEKETIESKYETSHILTDIVLQNTDNEAHKKEDLVAIIEQQSIVDDEINNESTYSDEQETAAVITETQVNISTYQDSSQKASVIGEGRGMESTDTGSPSHNQASPRSGTIELISEINDSMEISVNTENTPEVTSDQMTELPWDHKKPEDHLHQLKYKESEPEQTETPCSFIHIRQSKNPQEKVIAENSELNTSGKRRKMGSTRKSHNGRRHGGEKEEKEEKGGENDDEESYREEKELHVTERNITPSRKNEVTEEESEEIKEELKASPAVHSTTEEFIEVHSEQLTDSVLSSVTSELLLTTNIQPSPVADLSDSKQEDGNNTENAEMKNAELHTQSQSKKKKKFGSTRRPQGGNRPDNEKEGRRWVDLESTEGIEHAEEERCSKETSHQAASDLSSKPPSAVVEVSLGIFKPLLEKELIESNVLIEEDGRTAVEGVMGNESTSSNKNKVPPVSTNIQNDSHTGHDSSQEANIIVEGCGAESNDNESPSQMYSSPMSGTVELIYEDPESLDVQMNTGSTYGIVSEQIRQLPSDQSISVDQPDQPSKRLTELKQVETLSEQIRQFPSDQGISVDQPDQSSDRLSELEQVEIVSDQIRQLPSEQGISVDQPDQPSNGDSELEQVEIVSEQIRQLPSDQGISVDHPDQPSDRVTELEQVESTCSLIHTQESKNLQENIIPEISELNTSGKRRKMGSTRKSHKERLHGGGLKESMEEKNKKEEKRGEKDDEDSYREETELHVTERNITPSRKNEVTEEESEEIKEELKASPAVHSTTEEFIEVHSEQLTDSVLSSVTSELLLTTNIQPSPVADLSDSKQEDGNSTENAEIKNAELHTQSQSKKKKKFGSTRRPQGGNRPDNEKEGRRWVDLESTEGIEHDKEERCSKETSHQAASDLSSEPPSAVVEVSLGIFKPLLEKELIESNVLIEEDGRTAVEGVMGNESTSSNKHKVLPVSTNIQNDSHTGHDSSQEANIIVEGCGAESNDNESPSQMYSSPMSGTVELIYEDPESLDVQMNTGSTYGIVSEQIRQLPSDQSISVDQPDQPSKRLTELKQVETLSEQIRQFPSDQGISVDQPDQSSDRLSELEQVEIVSDQIRQLPSYQGISVDQPGQPSNRLSELEQVEIVSEQIRQLPSDQGISVDQPDQPSNGDSELEQVEIVSEQIRQLPSDQGISVDQPDQPSNRLSELEQVEIVSEQIRQLPSDQGISVDQPDQPSNGDSELEQVEIVSEQIRQFPSDQGISVDQPDQSSDRLSELEQVEIVSEQIRQLPSDQIISVDQPDQPSNRLSELEQLEIVSEQIRQLPSDQGMSVDQPDQPSHRRTELEQVEIVFEQNGQLPSDQGISVDHPHQPSDRLSELEQVESTCSLIHLQESKNPQENVITENSELNTSGKRRKMGSTRKSHKERLHEGGLKESMEEKTEKEEKRGEKDDEDSYREETELHVTERNITPSRKNEVTVEESEEIKEKLKASPVVHSTTEELIEVHSEKLTDSVLSSITSELLLTTNIQPSPVAEPSDSKQEDGNNTENAEMKNAELHTQSQSKKKKKFGSTRRPQGGNRPDNEEEGRRLKDLESTEGIKHAEEERCSKETSHQAATSDLSSEPPSVVVEVSLGILEPLLGKKFIKSNEETGKHEIVDAPHVMLTDSIVHHTDNEVSKAEEPQVLIEEDGQRAVEGVMGNESTSSNKNKVPPVSTNIQNDSHTGHDSSQEANIIVEGCGAESIDNESPSQIYSSPVSGTVELISEDPEILDVQMNTESTYGIVSEQMRQLPSDQGISVDQPDQPSNRLSELEQVEIVSEQIRQLRSDQGISVDQPDQPSNRFSELEQVEIVSEQIRQLPSDQGISVDQPDQSSDRLSELEQVEIVSEQIRQLPSDQGMSVDQPDQPSNGDSELEQVEIVSEQIRQLPSDQGISVGHPDQPSDRVTELEQVESTCSLIHTQESKNLQENIIPEISELNTSGKRRKMGSTRKSHKERLHGGGLKESMEEKNKKEEKRGEKDDEDSYREEKELHVTEKNFTPSRKYEVTEEESEEIKEELKASPAVHSTTEEFIEVHSEQLTDSVLSSVTSELLLTTNIQPSPVADLSDSKQEDGNSTENAEIKNAELHTQSQSKKKKKFGSTRRPQGGNRPDNEKEGRRWVDLESTEGIEHAEEERCSKETSHQAASDLSSEPPSAVVEVSLGIFKPLLEKELIESNVLIEEDGRTAVEGVMGNESTSSNKHKVLPVSTNIQNDSHTGHDSSQEANIIVEGCGAESNDNESPSQMCSSPMSGTVELISEDPESLDVQMNTGSTYGIVSEQIRQLPSDQSISVDQPDQPSKRLTELEQVENLSEQIRQLPSDQGISVDQPDQSSDRLSELEQVEIVSDQIRQLPSYQGISVDQPDQPSNRLSELEQVEIVSEQIRQLPSDQGISVDQPDQPSNGDSELEQVEIVSEQIRQLPSDQGISVDQPDQPSNRLSELEQVEIVSEQIRQLPSDQGISVDQPDQPSNGDSELEQVEIVSEQIRQLPSDQGISVDQPDQSSDRLSELEQVEIVSEQIRQLPSDQIISVDQPDQPSNRLSELEQVEIVSEQIRQLPSDQGMSVDQPDQPSHRRTELQQVEIVFEQNGQLPSDQGISVDHPHQPSDRLSELEQVESTCSLIHLQESKNPQENVITENSELNTSGKRRKMGSTRKSHKERLHEGGLKESMEEKTEKEEKRGEKDDEDSYREETELHVTERNITPSRKNEVTVEESEEIKEKLKASPVVHSTTEELIEVHSEKLTDSVLSSITSELLLTTNIQPSPVAEPSDSKQEDGNNTENAEMKNAELHTQSQSKKKKKFGSTRRPQGGNRPDNEEEGRRLKDLESTEGIKHAEEERFSKETSHQAATSDLSSEPPSAVVEVSLGTLEPLLEKKFIKSNEETEKHEIVDTPHVMLTDSVVHHTDNEVRKAEEPQVLIEEDGQTAVEGVTGDESTSSNKHKVPPVSTNIQNDSHTGHDSSQEANIIVEGCGAESIDNESPSQIYSSPVSGTVELISEDPESLDVQMNTESTYGIVSEQIRQLPSDQGISVDQPDQPSNRFSELEQVEIVSEQIRQLPSDQGISVDQPDQSLDRLSELEQVEIVSEQIRQLPSDQGMSVDQPDQPSHRRTELEQVEIVFEQNGQLPSDQGISVDHPHQPSDRLSELEQVESTCSLIHLQESKNPQENVITENSELNTSGKRRKMGSTRKSHKDRLHGGGVKEFMEKKTKKEEKGGEKDDEDSYREEKELHVTERNITPSRKNEVTEEESEEIKEELKASPAVHSTTEEFIEVHSEQLTDSVLSSVTSELLLTTNIQPSSVADLSDSKQEDGNSTENAEIKNAELHTQSQSRKKKKFGSTRRPQGGNRPDNEEEGRKLKDLESTEGIEHDEEERFSKETSHQAATSDLSSEPPSAVVEVSLGTLEPLLEKEFIKSNEETEKHEIVDTPHVMLTDSVVHHTDNEVRKAEEPQVLIEEDGQTAVEGVTGDESTSSNKHKVPPVSTNIQNDSRTGHDSSQEANVIVEGRCAEGPDNKIPSQIYSSPMSGTVELVYEDSESLDVQINTESTYGIVSEQIRQLPSDQSISVDQPDQPSNRLSELEQVESTCSLIHIQESKNPQVNVITENSELNTSGKRRKMGSTRKSHKERFHGGGLKESMEEKTEKEEKRGEKDDEDSYREEKELHVTERNITPSRKNEVTEEESEEIKEELKASPAVHSTTEEFIEVHSEQLTDSVLSSVTSELLLTTNIQPSPVADLSDSKQEDGNSTENAEIKNAELQTQSQSKKKKKFGSTRRPQGGNRPENEEEGRRWKDLESTEGIEHDEEERYSKETSHQAATSNLYSEPPSAVVKVSLGILEPLLEKKFIKSNEETEKHESVDTPHVMLTDSVVHHTDNEVSKAEEPQVLQEEDGRTAVEGVRDNKLEEVESTCSLIHIQESKNPQRNVITENPELNTCGKRRKMGSTRKSHKERLHGGGVKKSIEEKTEKEEKGGEKDDEDSYREEKELHVTERNITPSRKNEVTEEESEEIKEELKASPAVHSTTEEFIEVHSEQLTDSVLSSVTSELLLTTNIQPSPVADLSDSKQEDGNSTENAEMKNAELHTQSQSKKKKKFGSTRRPQLGNKPDNEEEGRRWKDLESTEGIDEKERGSSETSHQAGTSDVLTKPLSAGTELSLGILIEEMKEKQSTKEQTIAESTPVNEEGNSEVERLVPAIHTEPSHRSKELSESINTTQPQAEQLDNKKRKMGSTRKTLKGGDGKKAWGRTTLGMDLNADEDIAKEETNPTTEKDTVLYDKVFGQSAIAETSGREDKLQIHHEHDQSEGSLLSEIECELKKSCQSPLNTTFGILESSLNNALKSDTERNILEVAEPMAAQDKNSLELPLSQSSQTNTETSSPRRRRKMGSTRKATRNNHTEELGDETRDTEQESENLELGKNNEVEREAEDAKGSVDVTTEVQVASQVDQNNTEHPMQGGRRKFGSSRKAKGVFEPNQKEREVQVLTDELTGEPENTFISLSASDQENKKASPGTEQVEQSVVNEADVSTGTGLVSLDDLRKSALYNGSTGRREIIDFDRWNEQIPEFGVAVYNVVMVGNCNVGKTSFIRRFQSGFFSPEYSSTIGVDTFVQTITLGNRTVKLHIWDTAGQERYHSISTQVFHKAQGLLLMYDITSSESFCAVRNWISQIQEKAPTDVIMMLLGNKKDCTGRKVQPKEGEGLSRDYNIHFMECSAATGENVSESLKCLAWFLVKQNVRREEEQAILQPKQPHKKTGCC